MSHSERFLDIVNDAKSRIQELSFHEIKQQFDQGEHFHFIDVREDREWQKAHLPQAQHLGKGIIERDIEAAIPDLNAKIVLYCGGGYRSALAADNLQKMGYTNVYSMDGGFRHWKEAGYDIVSDV